MLSAGDDLDDFQAVTGLDDACREFGGSDSVAVMLDDNAAGREAAGNDELFDGTRDVRGDFLAVGDNDLVVHD